MSYRNDHDAALSRVDALEAELETLRVAYERERAQRDAEKLPPERTPRPLWAIGLVSAGVIALGAGFALRARGTEARAPRPVTRNEAAVERGPLPQDLADLRACREAIVPLATPLTATSTDPHGAHADVAPIAKTGAPCRRLLQSADSLALDPALHALVTRWSLAEDELIGAITRTRVYYASEPYEADHYASAPQLWREYDRALSARDAVLRDLAPLL